MKKFLKLIFLFIIFLLLDGIIKYYVYHNIAKMSFFHPIYPFGGIKVFKDFFGINFSIVHVENTGAAWGIFSKYTSLLVFIRIVIIIALISYLVFFNKNKKVIMPFLLIITGAIGNILDIFIYGKVIDMFYFKFWGYSYPVFNLADSMITIGIIWVIFLFFLENFKKKKA